MSDSFAASVQRPRASFRAAHRSDFSQVIALVGREKNIPLHKFTHRARGCSSQARARQLAMYLAHVVFGRPMAEVGAAFRRDRTTVSYACAVIEDLRDDPQFDTEVAGLEMRLEALRDRSHAHAH